MPEVPLYVDVNSKNLPLTERFQIGLEDLLPISLPFL